MVENPILEPNMKWIRSPVAEIWPFAYLWENGTPILGEGEVVGVSEVERAMVVSYSLSIVTIALSVTIRPQFAIECFRCSNQQGGSVRAQIWGVLLGVYPRCLGLQRANIPG